MKLLAVDIGAGTEDILLYDDAQPRLENCLKMVLPAPTQVYAAQVEAATRRGVDLFIAGDAIGGSAVSQAIRKHIEAGLRVTMTASAAYTVRNDREEVQAVGITVVATGPPVGFQGTLLTLEEINLTSLQAFLAAYNEPLTDLDVIAIAVQDHGVAPHGISNRRFRLQTMRKHLTPHPCIEALVFWEDEVPSGFLRMRAAVHAAKRQVPTAQVAVMDTAPAAVLGCLEDPVVKRATRVLAVNVGNGHTMAALLEDREVIGVLEHHTHLLSPPKMEHLLVAFAEGRVTDDAVFRDHGHGVFFLKPPWGFKAVDVLAVTGPQRGLLTETHLPVHLAAPGGDMMMTGTVGLVEAVKGMRRQSSP